MFITTSYWDHRMRKGYSVVVDIIVVDLKLMFRITKSDYKDLEIPRVGNLREVTTIVPDVATVAHHSYIVVAACIMSKVVAAAYSLLATVLQQEKVSATISLVDLPEAAQMSYSHRQRAAAGNPVVVGSKRSCQGVK